MNKLSTHKKLLESLGPIFSLLVALLIGGLFLILMGYNPINTYFLMFKNVFGSMGGLLQMLLLAQPLLLCGLAIRMGMRARVLNIGAGGQIYMGGLCAAAVGIYVQGLSAWIHIPLCLTAGMLGGALWSLVPILIKIKKGVSEIITGIMMIYIAELFVNFMVNGPMREPGAAVAQSYMIQESAKLPRLAATSQVSIGIIIGLMVAVLFTLILKHTVYGFEVLMIGSNKEAAQVHGIKTNHIMIYTTLISGACAGLAGSVEVLGTFQRLIQGFAGSAGFEGIAVAVLGTSPMTVIISALMFGTIKTGTTSLEYTIGLSEHFVSVLQGLVIVLIAAPALLPKLIDWVQNFVHQQEGERV
jgi:simple sugar transport system permease protein